MPRPDKKINSSGPLYAPASSSRAVVWKKHAGHEAGESVEDESGAFEITIGDLTLSIQPTAPPDAETSKWATRATSAQLPLSAQVSDAVVGEARVAREPQPIRTEWMVTRSIEGRTYRRTDVLTTVEEHSGA